MSTFRYDFMHSFKDSCKRNTSIQSIDIIIIVIHTECPARLCQENSRSAMYAGTGTTKFIAYVLTTPSLTQYNSASSPESKTATHIDRLINYEEAIPATHQRQSESFRSKYIRLRESTDHRTRVNLPLPRTLTRMPFKIYLLHTEQVISTRRTLSNLQVVINFSLNCFPSFIKVLGLSYFRCIMLLVVQIGICETFFLPSSHFTT